MAEDAFFSAEQDGDGLVSVAELASMDGVGLYSGRMVVQAFDTDHDGRLSLAEFNSVVAAGSQAMAPTATSTEGVMVGAGGAFVPREGVTPTSTTAHATTPDRVVVDPGNVADGSSTSNPVTQRTLAIIGVLVGLVVLVLLWCMCCRRQQRKAEEEPAHLSKDVSVFSSAEVRKMGDKDYAETIQGLSGRATLSTGSLRSLMEPAQTQSPVSFL